MSKSRDKNQDHKITRILHLGRALRLVWQNTRGLTIAGSALLFVQGMLPLVSLFLMKLMIDAVAAGMGASDMSTAFGRVAFLIGLAGLTALLSVLFGSLSGLVSEAQSHVITDRVSDMLHVKSVEIDLEYYENPRYFDTLHRAQQEGPSRPTRIVNGLIQVGQNGISLLAMAGLLFSFHWGVAVILFAAVVPGILVRLRYSGTMYQWQHQHTPAERQSWYYHWLLTGDAHAKEIRLFDLGSLFIVRFRELRKQLMHERIEISRKRSIAELSAQIVTTVAIFGSYAFIAYRTVHGAITLGDLVMYTQAFQRGQAFLSQLLGGLAGLYEDSLFLSNFYEFLDLRPKIVSPHRPVPVSKSFKTGIVFDRVSFHYPGGDRKVLEDISLTIRPGEHVALVGENGAGKTTLIKLLCRLYDPSAGVITLNGVDLRQYDIRALRREISVILQDYARYQMTARENIWFGDLSLPDDCGRIVDAARQADADRVIAGLPRGYGTLLGKWFEDGEELSIGEWQKVALARVFLRTAQIIVLDEPTSSLDARAEHDVFRKFRHLAEGRTAILISHRFSTVRMADRIFVLENGGIADSGSHDELMRRGGIYARLFELQAQHFR
ncbi:ABC transporter ATP-binding protein [bacterium]|nr:ABC transporter ATP-binding protein [bacterium]